MDEKSEPRMAGSYVIEAAQYINGKEVVFGTDEKAQEKYYVAYCSYNNPFGIAAYMEGISTGNYAEAMQDFGSRISTQAMHSLRKRKERGIYETLCADDCISGSRGMDYEGQLIVIRSDVLQRDKRTADYQLCLATDGFGCSPKASGRAVYVLNLYDNRRMRYDRSDVLGIIKPERIPEWAKEKVKELESHMQKQKKKNKDRCER